MEETSNFFIWYVLVQFDIKDQFTHGSHFRVSGVIL